MKPFPFIINTGFPQRLIDKAKKAVKEKKGVFDEDSFYVVGYLGTYQVIPGGIRVEITDKPNVAFGIGVPNSSIENAVKEFFR